jgi:hypothetical protein
MSEGIHVSGHDLTDAMWCKAAHSNGDGNVCVEVAFLSGAAAVRDSKNPDGGVLLLSPAAWRQLRQATEGTV